MRFPLLIISALSTLLSLSRAWEPVIDPWDSHGRSKQGEKMALVRYTDGNCTTQMEQNHFKVAGLRGRNCHSFEWPFNSIAFEYPRVPRTGWQLIRGCKIRLFRGPSCEDELPRHITDPQEKQCVSLEMQAWSLNIENCVFCPGGNDDSC